MASLKGSSHLLTQVPERMSHNLAWESYPQDKNFVSSIQVKSNIPAPLRRSVKRSCLVPVAKSNKVRLGVPSNQPIKEKKNEKII